MNLTHLHNDAAPAGTTEAGRPRPLRSAPRRWWRAVDRMTLETMNPPVPAHVRAARHNLNATVRPEPGVPAGGGSQANHIR